MPCYKGVLAFLKNTFLMYTGMYIPLYIVKITWETQCCNYTFEDSICITIKVQKFKTGENAIWKLNLLDIDPFAI